MKKRLFLYKCELCGEYFVAEIKRHKMYSCPTNDCHTAVDLEIEYSRYLGKPKLIRIMRVDENET
jgi:hypothetical protein